MLSALEPFSIDLYLPGFLRIADYFHTDLKAVQMSISTFLGGFAVGQLFWGILSDRYGRKIPILISLILFLAASTACIYVETIEGFWIARFFQAFAGCAGVVIARAIVNEYFDRDKTMQVFSLLAIIAGVAPIVGPVLGNFLIQHYDWQAAFITLIVFGALCVVMVIFFLPETLVKQTEKTTPQRTNLLKDFKIILQNKVFLKYTLIGSLTYSVLMIYLANAPYIIMEYGGLSANVFSAVFAFNAIGLVLGAWISNSVLAGRFTPLQIVRFAIIFGSTFSLLFLFACLGQVDVKLLLALLFFIIVTLGVLFPVTTQLALQPFKQNSGSASALLGSVQLMVTFIISAITNIIQADILFLTGFALLICHLLYFVCLLLKDTNAALAK